MGQFPRGESPLDSSLRILDEVLTNEGKHIIMNNKQDPKHDISFAKPISHKIELLKKDAQNEMITQTFRDDGGMEEGERKIYV